MSLLWWWTVELNVLDSVSLTTSSYLFFYTSPLRWGAHLEGQIAFELCLLFKNYGTSTSAQTGSLTQEADPSERASRPLD